MCECKLCNKGMIAIGPEHPGQHVPDQVPVPVVWRAAWCRPDADQQRLCGEWHPAVSAGDNDEDDDNNDSNEDVSVSNLTIKP